MTEPANGTPPNLPLLPQQRAPRIPKITTPEVVIPNVSVDLSPMARSIEKFAQALNDTARKITRWIERHYEKIREAANTPAAVAGIEGHFYVTAGLDPAYADPAVFDRLIAEILTGEAESCALLSQENRALVASTALRAWVTHRPEGPPRPLAWHRLIGDAALEVSRG